MGHRRQQPKHLAEKLLAIRQRLSLSQSQMARAFKCKVSAARLSEYEHGTREANLTVLLRYSKLTRISVNALIDDDKELKFPKNLKPPNNL